MTKMMKQFWNDKSGATAIEYGLIAALISVALITGATALGKAINGKFSTIANRVNTGV